MHDCFISFLTAKNSCLHPGRQPWVFTHDPFSRLCADGEVSGGAMPMAMADGESEGLEPPNLMNPKSD